MNDPLPVGIIGCGAIAQLSHIPCILEHDERFTLAAVSDVSASLLEAVADRHGIADRAIGIRTISLPSSSPSYCRSTSCEACPSAR